jgi:hypothetical protein
MGQERSRLGRTHFARTLPVDIDLLGPEAIVLVAYSLAEPIQHGWTVERDGGLKQSSNCMNIPHMW